MRDELSSGRDVVVGALLKTIHDAARGLRTELDLPWAAVGSACSPR